MTKIELLKRLEGVDDDALIYFEAEKGIYLVQDVTTLTSDSLQQVILSC